MKQTKMQKRISWELAMIDRLTKESKCSIPDAKKLIEKRKREVNDMYEEGWTPIQAADELIMH